MRLIDADTLTEIIKRQICGNCDNRCESGMYCGELALMKLIEAEPTVDAVPVRHARWLVNEKMRWIVCSACGTNVPVVAGWCMDAHINFCPNCGAKMEDGK